MLLDLAVAAAARGLGSHATLLQSLAQLPLLAGCARFSDGCGTHLRQVYIDMMCSGGGQNTPLSRTLLRAPEIDLSDLEQRMPRDHIASRQGSRHISLRMHMVAFFADHPLVATTIWHRPIAVCTGHAPLNDSDGGLRIPPSNQVPLGFDVQRVRPQTTCRWESNSGGTARFCSGWHHAVSRAKLPACSETPRPKRTRQAPSTTEVWAVVVGAWTGF